MGCLRRVWKFVVERIGVAWNGLFESGMTMYRELMRERKSAENAAITPRFAVCLAAYNGMEYIEAQVRSIMSQRDVSVQIFVSVDKSTDGTEAFLSKFAASERRLTILPFGQRFGGASPNFFRIFRDVDFSGFDYISLADQDDIWHPEKLLRAHRSLGASGGSGYSSNVTAFWPTGETQLVDKAQPQRSWDYLFEASGPGCTYVLTVDFALQVQALVRRAGAKVSQVGYHDWLIYALARASENPWVIDSWPSMQYRQHANNQIGVNSGWRSYVSRVRKMLTGHGFDQALLIADLVGAGAVPIVRRGLLQGRLGYVWLSFRAAQCRRKRIDQVWFFILCWVFAIAGEPRRAELK